ncbi:MAG: 8-oxo-dGTP diphosphatase MutT [Halioglobus sp.]
MTVVHVAVGVILDSRNRVLIAKRSKESHQGGLWEFPGGKVEAGESVQNALERELHEELGIHIGHATPLTVVSHDYGDKSVCLDVWLVAEFTGTATGCEGQPLLWVGMGELGAYDFPEANASIVDAVMKLDVT